MEIVIIALVAFLPYGRMDYLANVLISFASSLQTYGFSKMYGQRYATTMCTGNLRNATESLSVYIREREIEQLKVSARYFAVILSFIAGTVIAAFAVRWTSVSILLAEIPVIIVFFVIMRKKKQL